MAGQNNFFLDVSVSLSNLYNERGNHDNPHPTNVYRFYPEISDQFHWHYFSKKQRSQASGSSTPGSSIMPIEELSNA